MTTALQLITDAMGQLGLTETGQELTAEDAALGLRALNRMMGKWSNMRLLFPVLASYSVTLTGAASYTIGPGGDVSGLRPIEVVYARAVDANGIEYPVEVLSQVKWNGIADKATTGGPPCSVWYSPTNTLGRLYVYPVATGYTLKLDAQALLSSFSGLTTELALPDGYEAAIVPCLADELGSSFSVNVPADVLRRAAGAVRALKRTNAEPVESPHELAGDREFDINRGY